MAKPELVRKELCDGGITEIISMQAKERQDDWKLKCRLESWQSQNSVIVVWHEWEHQKDGKTRLKLKIMM